MLSYLGINFIETYVNNSVIQLYNFGEVLLCLSLLLFQAASLKLRMLNVVATPINNFLI